MRSKKRTEPRDTSKLHKDTVSKDQHGHQVVSKLQMENVQKPEDNHVAEAAYGRSGRDPQKLQPASGCSVGMPAQERHHRQLQPALKAAYRLFFEKL